MYFQSDNTTNSNRGVASSSGLFTTGEWVHFAMVYDGTATGNSNRLKAYVNGVALTLTIQGTIPATTNSTSSTTQVGSRGGGISFSGSIDQVRIFSKALSSSEVSTLYAETACVHTSTTDIVNYPTGTTPIAYYKLDNSSEDFSTGSYDGTDTNVEYRFGRLSLIHISEPTRPY